MNDKEKIKQPVERQSADGCKAPSLKPRKHRPWWLRTLRGIGWVALCAVLFVVIVCSAVVWTLSPDQLTPIVERVASRSLNADVRLGRAELTFWSSFPRVEVQIDDLQVITRSLGALSEQERAALPADADSVVSIGHFSGSVNLLKIAGGHIAIHDVEIDRPRFNLIQVNDTVSNFDIFPPSPQEPDTAKSVMPDITIDHFAITDALPFTYRSLPDSVDVDIQLHTISLSSSDTPRYKLQMSTRIATPLLHEVSYDEMQFGLDGIINWSAAMPSTFNISGLRFTIDDDIDLTVNTSVDITNDLRFNTLDIMLSNLRISHLLEHAPRAMRDKLQDIDTDLAFDLSASLTRPFVLTDSITFPYMHAKISIPESYFRWQSINFNKIAGEISADIDGADLDASTVDIGRLYIDGKAMDINLSGRLTNLMSDPMIDADFRGAIDFGQLPYVIRQRVGGSLSGLFSADTHLKMHLSDFSPQSFHKANLKGDVNLRNLRYCSRDTMTRLFTHHAELSFGTDETFRNDSCRADSLLVVKVSIDTAAIFSEGLQANIKSLRGGFGSSNTSASSDTTVINPFGGAIHIADVRYYSPADSVHMRMRDIGGFASLHRYKGEGRVPQLMLRFGSDKIFMMQPMFMTFLSKAKVDVTAHLRPRRRRPGQPSVKGAADTVHAPRLNSGDLQPGFARNDSLRRDLRSRSPLLTAAQLDSVGAELIDFDVDNSMRSLLRRWNLHGTLQADKGALRLPNLKLRNSFSDLDLAFTSDSINLRSLNYRFGHSDFCVKGIVSNIRRALSTKRPGAVKVDFDIESDSINVNEIVRSIASAQSDSHRIDTNRQLDEWIREEEIEFEHPQEVPDSVIGPILVPVNIDAALNIHAAKVIYSDLVLSDFGGELLVYHGAVNLHNLTAQTDVGKIDISALYQAPTPRDISLGLAMDLHNFYINRLPQMVPAIDSLMPMMQYLSGVVNAQIAVTSDITPDMYFDIPTLKAAMQFSGDSLVVFDNDTFRSLSKWLMFKNKKHNMIDHLNVEMTIEDGMLNIYPFMLNIDRYKLGVMGYNDLDFNLHYHVAVLKSPIPFKFGINIKGRPGKMKIRLGGAKFKEKMVAQRDSIAINTRISLMSEINSAFRRGLRAARLGPLRIQGDTDSTYMNAAEERFSLADSAVMVRQGLIELPDSVAADIISRASSQNENSDK